VINFKGERYWFTDIPRFFTLDGGRSSIPVSFIWTWEFQKKAACVFLLEHRFVAAGEPRWSYYHERWRYPSKKWDLLVVLAVRRVDNSLLTVEMVSQTCWVMTPPVLSGVYELRKAFERLTL
jgi:hypothetical protein